MKPPLRSKTFGTVRAWPLIGLLFLGSMLFLRGQNPPKAKSPWLGEWFGPRGNQGTVVLDIRDQGTGEPKSIAVWWLVEELRLGGQPRFENDTVYIDRLDHKFHSAPGLAFRFVSPDRIKLVPYGVFSMPLDPLLDGMILTRVVTSGSRSQTTFDHYKYSEGSKWHAVGNLKALPPDWPAAVTMPTATLLSYGSHEFQAALVESTLPASYLAEAYALTEDKPVWGDQKDYVQLAIAKNTNTSAETLEKIWATPENPQLWMAVAANPNARQEWHSGLVDRIINSSDGVKHRAIWNRDGPPELYLRLIKDSRQIRGELASRPRMPAFVYEILARDYPEEARGRLAGNETVSAEIIESFAGTEDRGMKFTLIQNKKLSPATRRKLVVELVQTASANELRRFSGDPDTPPEFLARCAEDLDPGTRASVASNPQTTETTLSHLARDEARNVATAARSALKMRFPEVHTKLAPSWEPLESLEADMSLISQFQRAIERADFTRLTLLAAHFRANNQLDWAFDATVNEVVKTYRPEIMDFFLANDFNKHQVALADVAGESVLDPRWFAYFQERGAFKGSLAGRSFQKAIERERNEILAGLIEAKLDVNAPAPDGMTPLHRAVLYHNWRAIDLLLSAKARTDSPDARGQTPLDYAVRAKFIPAIKLMDKDGKYAALIESFTQEFPAAPASRFLGQWTNDMDGFSTVKLRLESDGTGLLAASFSSMLVAWHETSADEVVAFMFNEKGEVERKLQFTFHLNSEGTELLFETKKGEKQKMKRDKR